MAIEGVDYADGRPGGAALAAAGKRFACRYVPYGGFAKGLTAPEVRDLHNHGIAICLNFEQVARRALEGRPAGIIDARTSQLAAKELGFPVDRPIYFSVDFNVSSAQLGIVAAYFEGVADILGAARVGAYGGGNLLRYLAAHGLARWFWNAASTSWGALYAGSHVWQYLTGSMGAKPINGAAVDYDRALQADYGQWPLPPSGGPAQEDSAVIYTLGGIHTGIVGQGVAYSREPGSVAVGHTGPARRYLLTATDATGAHVALDGLYEATAPLGVPVACGWVPRTAVTDVQPVPLVQAAPAPPAPVADSVTIHYTDGSSAVLKGA